jgi:hypothetical protein
MLTLEHEKTDLPELALRQMALLPLVLSAIAAQVVGGLGAKKWVEVFEPAV